jgi:alginate O-acetyltransferase complex protein AlgI
MSFASVVFCLFLPVVFVLHYCCARRQWQNGVLLVASYIFYGWWDYRFCGLMLYSSLVDYAIGQKLATARSEAQRRALLVLTLVSNLGLLGFFKYFNFFADSLVLALAVVGVDVNPTTLNIVLPVGISFYTFQTLSYTLDIYRGQLQPRRNLLEYLTFVSFFPQLVAGPIARATHLLPQFAVARKFSPEAAAEGCRLILWGLAKKMILADNLGGIVSSAFDHVPSASGAQLALATVCFTFQIYCDFSGYSDIAAGTASLFGIRLMRNFAYPYFSQSLSEFWRRWHISLSTWFRDYVFIPLGGSRDTAERTSRNLLLTFLLSGLWHGAAWHFVAWGVLHGLYVMAARWLSRGMPAERPAVPGGESLLPSPQVLWRMTRTFFLVCVGWVLFRADSLAAAEEVYRRMVVQAVNPHFYSSLWRLVGENRTVLLALGVFIIVEWLGRFDWNPLPIHRLPVAARWLSYTALFWAILYLGTQRSSDFIYFQF